MPKQIRLKIDTTFVETKPAGLGAKYLNSGEIDTRAGIEIAIGCLFAALGAAECGASRKKIENLSAIARTQLEVYLSLALTRCNESCDYFVCEAINLTKTSVAVNVAEEFEPDENIDFDNEEI